MIFVREEGSCEGDLEWGHHSHSGPTATTIFAIRICDNGFCKNFFHTDCKDCSGVGDFEWGHL